MKGLSTFSKVVLIVFCALLLIGALLGIALRCGLMLAKVELYLWLLVFSVADMAVWGIYGICRKIEKNKTRLIVGTLLAILLLALFTFASSSISYLYAFVSTRYTDVHSESGQTLTIMRRYHYDQERVNSRYGDGSGEDADPRSLDDFSYMYTAFPKKLWLFVDANADSQGEIVMGVDSEGKLMVEWPDENTARLYLENPGEDDSGEIIVKFD